MVPKPRDKWQVVSTPALVLCWSASEPDRVGQIARLLPGDHRVRADGAPSDDAPLVFTAERPGDVGEERPLQPRGSSTRLSIHVSLFDVRIRASGGQVAVNGSHLPDGQWQELEPGDTVHLWDDVLLLFTLRPELGPLRHFPAQALGAFGAPDTLGIVGESPAVWRWRETIAAIASAGEHVLIDGEIGTGKSLTAGGIHALSPRSSQPMWRGRVRSDWEVPYFFYGHAKDFRGCPEEESEGLLGYVAGGTMLIDNAHYCKRTRGLELLDAVLERGGEYRRVADPSPRTSKFVLVVATNEDPRDLQPLLLKHLRRRITTPTLAEHPEDIPLLLRTKAYLHPRKREPDDASPYLAAEARTCSDPRVVDRLLREDYRNGGVFRLAQLVVAETLDHWSGGARRVGA